MLQKRRDQQQLTRAWVQKPGEVWVRSVIVLTSGLTNQESFYNAIDQSRVSAPCVRSRRKSYRVDEAAFTVILYKVEEEQEAASRHHVGFVYVLIKVSNQFHFRLVQSHLPFFEKFDASHICSLVVSLF